MRTDCAWTGETPILFLPRSTAEMADRIVAPPAGTVAELHVAAGQQVGGHSGEGDGEVNPFVSGAVALGDFNLMAATGMRIRVDADDSSFWDLDVHLDYELGSFYPFVEFGLIHVLAAGNRLPIQGEGQDLFNFGSSDSDNETLVTATGGLRYRLTKDIDIGISYQIPLTTGAGSNIIDYRWNTDLIFRFEV